MKKTLSLILILVIVISGCSTEGSKSILNINTENGKVKLKEIPKRIVSLDLMYTEMLTSIGVDLVGISVPSDFNNNVPYYLADKIDPTTTEVLSEGNNIDNIKELNPDLILATENNQDDYKKLKKIAPTIVIKKSELKEKGWQQITLDIGPTFNKGQEAKDVVASYGEQLTKINKQLNETLLDYTNTKAIYIDISEGKITYVDSAVLNRSLKFKKPILEPFKKNKSELTMDILTRVNPDYILLGTETKDAVKQFINKNPEFKKLKAYKNKSYYEVDKNLWNYGEASISEILKLNQIEEFIKEKTTKK